MPTDPNTSYPEGIRVSLVNGDPAIRHARQLMLLSEKYVVRSYPTCAAILADPASRNQSCIILDLEMEEADGVAVLQEMRASGWRGRALLLDRPDNGNAVQKAEQQGYKVLPRDVGDQTLLTAIAATVDRGWAGWNAVG